MYSEPLFSLPSICFPLPCSINSLVFCYNGEWSGILPSGGSGGYIGGGGRGMGNSVNPAVKLDYSC